MAQATSALVTTAAGREAADRAPRGSPPEDYPVREYIGAMATELAQMARWDGDEALGCALDVVVRLAGKPAPVPAPVDTGVTTGPATGRG